MTSPNDHLLDRIKKLPVEVRLLLEKRIELYVIEFGENVSKNASKVISGLVSGLVFVLALVFGLFALAFFVGHVLNSNAAGFAVVSALLLVFGLVVYLLSPELIESRLRDKIASVFLGPHDFQESVKYKTDQNKGKNDSQTTSEISSENSMITTKPN
jgi:uncharacterized membrane protein YqjE